MNDEEMDEMNNVQIRQMNDEYVQITKYMQMIN